MESVAEIETSFHALIDRQARERPEHPFLECIDTGRSLTFAQAREVSNRIAAWSTHLGIGANDRVMIVGGNSLEYLILYLGILRHGATLCALPESMGANFVAILDAVRPQVVLYQEGLDLDVPQRHSTISWVPYARWPVPAAIEGEFFTQVSRCPASTTAAVGRPADLATITYTSGTTGRPKGIVHHYSAIMANASGTARALGMTSADRILEYRSFAWLSGRARLMMALYSGATLVIAQKFSQSRFFDWIVSQKLTIAFAVPTVIAMLVNRPVPIKKEDLLQLRFVTSSTAPLAVEHQRAFEELYGIEIVQIYGISESGGVTINPPGRRKLGSVGTAALYQDVRIIADDGSLLPAGEIGDIEVGGEQVCTGYLEYDGGITTLRGSRFKTGDLGYQDPDGYLFITGRRSETINRGGAKVSPIEIDNVLLSHPDIAEAATIGVPDKIYGEEITSFVVPRSGRRVDPTQLVSHCALTLPKFKLPKQIEIVEQIPKNARAKVDKKELLETWRLRNSNADNPPDPMQTVR